MQRSTAPSDTNLNPAMPPAPDLNYFALADTPPSINRPERAVLFDLDGTMIDTLELIVQAYQHTTTVHLGAPIERAAVLPEIGRSLLASLEELAPGRGDLLMATYQSFNQEHHDRLVRPIPGMVELLQNLHRTGYRLGMVTAKRRSTARMSLASGGLSDLLETHVCFEDTDRHKPHPDPLLLGASRLQVTPADTVYVGDSVHDIAAAHAAGMPVVGVLWGAGCETELQALRPTALIRQPAELLPLLEDALWHSQLDVARSLSLGKDPQA